MRSRKYPKSASNATTSPTPPIVSRRDIESNFAHTNSQEEDNDKSSLLGRDNKKHTRNHQHKRKFSDSEKKSHGPKNEHVKHQHNHIELTLLNDERDKDSLNLSNSSNESGSIPTKSSSNDDSPLLGRRCVSKDKFS